MKYNVEVRYVGAFMLPISTCQNYFHATSHFIDSSYFSKMYSLLQLIVRRETKIIRSVTITSIYSSSYVLVTMFSMYSNYCFKT